MKTIIGQLLPREKIAQNGIESLTTQEILRVILGSGSKNLPVQLLAQKIEEKIPNRHVTVKELRKIKGVGVAKACQVLAVLELVERLRPIGTPLLDSLDKVLQQVHELRSLSREHLVCLYLNTRLQLLMKETLAVGGLNQVAILPRDIFAVIKQFPVYALILAHNHPSGDPTPSAEDIQFTHQMKKAGELLGIELLDHVIVSAHAHYSLKEQHVL